MFELILLLVIPVGYSIYHLFTQKKNETTPININISSKYEPLLLMHN